MGCGSSVEGHSNVATLIGAPGNMETTLLAFNGTEAAKALIQSNKDKLPYPGLLLGAELCELIDAVEAVAIGGTAFKMTLHQAVRVWKLLSSGGKAQVDEWKFRAFGDRLLLTLRCCRKLVDGYSTRHVFWRVLTAQQDGQLLAGYAADLEALAQELPGSRAEASGRAQLDSLTWQLEASVKELRDLIEALGGAAEIAGSTTKCNIIAGRLHMDGKALSARMQEASSLVDAAREDGSHSLLRSPALRAFWRAAFGRHDRVGWKYFWDAFPAGLAFVPLSPEAVEELDGLLKDPAHRQQLQARLEDRRDPDTVSVQELNAVFAPERDVVDVVKAILSEVPGTGDPARPVRGPCELPRLEPAVSGREQLLATLLLHLNVSTVGQSMGRAAVLHGGAGQGKSSLAQAAGTQLWQEGRLPGGVFMADLRGCCCADDMEARFYSAVAGTMPASENAVLPQLYARLAQDGAFLLIVDNADDALEAMEPAGASMLSALVRQCLRATSASKVIVTARRLVKVDAPGVLNHELKSLDLTTAPGLVETLLKPLRDHHAAPGAAGLQGIQDAVLQAVSSRAPMLLRLGCAAVLKGTLTMEALSNSPGSLTLDDLLRKLSSREGQAMVGLAIFPSEFSSDAAATVLTSDPYAVEPLLQHLMRQGLLQRSSHSGQYSMPPAVRDTLRRMSGELRTPLKGLSSSMLTLQVVPPEPPPPDIVAARKAALQGFAVHCTAAARLVRWLVRQERARSSATGFAEEMRPDFAALLSYAAADGMDDEFVTTLVEWLPRDISDRGPSVVSLLDLRHHPKLQKALQTMRSLLEKGEQTAGPADYYKRQTSIWEVLGAQGSVAYMRGHWRAAEAAYARVWKMQKAALLGEEPDRQSASSAMRHAGSALRELGEAVTARGTRPADRALYTQAVKVMSWLTGEDTADVLTESMRAMRPRRRSSMDDSLPDKVPREKRQAESLHLWSWLLGDAYPRVLASLDGLAVATAQQARYAEAERLFCEVLPLTRLLLGDTHVDTLTSALNLAKAIQAQGSERSGEAEKLYRQVLEGRKSRLGAEHADVAVVLGALADCLASQRRLQEAEDLLRQALDMQRKLLGSDHPAAADAAAALASNFAEQGRHEEAEVLLREVLALRRGLLGPEHPEVCAALNHLAAILCTSQRFEEAEALYKESLGLTRKLLGETHPEAVAQCASSVAAAVSAQGRHPEAERLYREALDIQIRVHGDDHVLVAGAMTDLGAELEMQHKVADAISLYRSALAIYEKTVGSQHPAAQELASSLRRMELAGNSRVSRKSS